MEYLRENPRPRRVITNNAHMVYIHADGGWAYAALPAFSLETANASLDDVLDNAIETADGEILVVWLTTGTKTAKPATGRIRCARPRVSKWSAELSDGAVFRVKTDGARERTDFLTPR